MSNLHMLPTPIVAAAKWAFTTRRVNKADVGGISKDFHFAQSGDLVIAEVVSIGSHKCTQLATGRNSTLYVGDKIVLCCGDRYAPDQFEGRGVIVSDVCDMLAGGGLIGKMNYKNEKISDPTQLRPIGLLTDSGGDIINIASYSIPNRSAPSDLTVIGVVGASMNAGKTTATVALAYGLKQAGYNVATIKATGTGAFGDFNAMIDAGIEHVADFTDAGMPSTYLQSADRVEQGMSSLLADAKANGADIAVVELADGIYQKETANLLENSELVKGIFDGFMYASGDAVSAVGGVKHLRNIGYEPVAVSGMVSLSPLAVKEAEAITGVSILKKQELECPDLAKSIISPILAKNLKCLTQSA